MAAQDGPDPIAPRHGWTFSLAKIVQRPGIAAAMTAAIVARTVVGSMWRLVIDGAFGSGWSIWNVSSSSWYAATAYCRLTLLREGR